MGIREAWQETHVGRSCNDRLINWNLVSDQQTELGANWQHKGRIGETQAPALSLRGGVQQTVYSGENWHLQ